MTMKNDREIMQQVRSAIDDCTRGIHEAPSLRYQILKQAKGEPPVKKKISAALALAMVMILLVSGAFAAKLFNSDVLSWLFRNDDIEPSQEVLDLLDQPNQHQLTDYIDLTLTETLFDGRKLSVSFTLQNPTDELLIYTIGDARLNGEDLFAESALLPFAKGYGQALSGEVDGQAISSTARVVATFAGASAPREEPMVAATPAPLHSADPAELSIQVDVYRAHAPLAYLAAGETLTESTFLGQGTLAIEQESNLLQLRELLAHPDATLLEKVETKTFTFPICMGKANLTTVSALPGVYWNDLFSLEMQEFTLSATSGQLKGRITIPSPVKVKDALPADLSFFYAFPEETFEQAREHDDFMMSLPIRTQSGAGVIDPESDQPATFDIDASFGATHGTLPRGVYLVWITDNLGKLDWNTSLYVPMQ